MRVTVQPGEALSARCDLLHGKQMWDEARTFIVLQWQCWLSSGRLRAEATRVETCVETEDLVQINCDSSRADVHSSAARTCSMQVAANLEFSDPGA